MIIDLTPKQAAVIRRLVLDAMDNTDHLPDLDTLDDILEALPTTDQTIIATKGES